MRLVGFEMEELTYVLRPGNLDGTVRPEISLRIAAPGSPSLFRGREASNRDGIYAEAGRWNR
jgi:hypothetical protein